MFNSSHIRNADADREQASAESQPSPEWNWPGSSAASSTDGPATILNPGQQQQREAAASEPPSVSDSELLRRLFPADSSSAEPLTGLGPAGCRLDHYRIEQPIGRGGMGAVFRAVDERLDRVVALKVLSPTFSRDPSTVHRFCNEARAAARLDHENIARVFYTGVDKGVHFISFEYVTGTNLRDLIQQRGRLAPDEAVNYALQIASALCHTSAAGVVHRDIKPSNIIVTPSGRAKLVDLGLARKEYSESAPELTVAGTTLGTFDYISPEQARDPRNVDVRSDIYSLGCTLYHMLTGEPPYPEGNFFKKLLDRQDKSPPNPAQRAPNIPPDLAHLVQRMMAGNPRQRPLSAEKLVNDLMLIAGQLGLRGVHPEGLVWTFGANLNRPSFWERHLGWMATAAMLLVIVFLVERLSRNETASPPHQTENNTQSSRVVSSDGNSNDTSSPSSSNQESSSGQKRTDEPSDDDGSGNTGQSTETGHSAPAGDSGKPVHRFSQIPRNLLAQSIGEAAGSGAVGVSGFASRFSWDSSNGSGDPATKTLTADGDSDSNDSDDSDSAGGSGTTSNADTPGAAEPLPAIVLSGENGSAEGYPSLEGACRSANPGQTVLLRYNGLRRDAEGEPIVERPLKVDKSVTIRAAKGYRPVVLFAGEEVPASEPQTRMITVADGSLTISNVTFILSVNDAIASDEETRWALFSLQGADRIWLRGVHVTVENPHQRPAAVFEVTDSSNPDVSKMMKMKKSASSSTVRFDAQISECFFRGECDFFTVDHPREGVVDLRSSAVVVGQSLMRVQSGDSSKPDSEMARIELKLVHVTSLLGRHFLLVSAGGALSGSVLPVRVSARDNIVASQSQGTLVSMTGASSVKKLQQLLFWEGQKNFYDQFAVMWDLIPDDPTAPGESRNFDAWKQYWSTNSDARSGGVVWKHDWTGKTPGAITPEDLRLDTGVEASRNPAVTETTDGTAAGVDVSNLPSPPIEDQPGYRPHDTPDDRQQ